jgi:hypothetical protein
VAAELNGAQGLAVADLCAEHGAKSYVVERDEAHDAHVFVTLYHADGPAIGEWIVEGDGSIDGEGG